MQETGKYQESAETELETCYHGKRPDEFIRLADCDPHRGRLWLTAEGKTESYASFSSITVAVFRNTHIHTHTIKK